MPGMNSLTHSCETPVRVTIQTDRVNENTRPYIAFIIKCSECLLIDVACTEITTLKVKKLERLQATQS